MSKLRKIMMGIIFTLIIVMGVSTGSNNVKAATTKNFKGNLNVTYKNSEWKSKITIKKVNSRKVSIKIVYDGYAKFKYTGKIASKSTIKFNAVNNEDGYADVIFKWKDKSHFTSTWKEKRSNGLKYCSDELVFALDNAKYTQVKKSNTVYYASNGNSYKSVISIKKNKIIVKGKLTKGTKKSYAKVKGKVTKLKSATKTFALANNIKFYGNGGEDPNPSRMTKKDGISVIKNSEFGTLPFILTIKNGKAVRIDFYS